MAMTGLLHFFFPMVCCSGRILDYIFLFVKVASRGSRSVYALLLLTGGHGGFSSAPMKMRAFLPMLNLDMIFKYAASLRCLSVKEL